MANEEYAIQGLGQNTPSPQRALHIISHPCLVHKMKKLQKRIVDRALIGTSNMTFKLNIRSAEYYHYGSVTQAEGPEEFVLHHTY